MKMEIGQEIKGNSPSKAGYFTKCSIDMKTGKSYFLGYERIKLSDKIEDLFWENRHIVFILMFINILGLVFINIKMITILLTFTFIFLIYWKIKGMRVVD